VDAFVYENCSLNVDTFSEFCTGAKISSGYGQVWDYDNGNFLYLRTELRQFHEELDWNGQYSVQWGRLSYVLCTMHLVLLELLIRKRHNLTAWL
jgi:hypothetical protein